MRKKTSYLEKNRQILFTKSRDGNLRKSAQSVLSFFPGGVQFLAIKFFVFVRQVC